MPEHIQVDVAIIGSGSAGLAAWRTASQAGKKVVIIESGPIGTTCARVGCMPSKLLIAAADSAHAVRQAPLFGIQSGKMKIDGKKVMKRLQDERDRFVKLVIDSIDSIPATNKISGRARFIDAHTLMVDEHTKVSANSVVIATGSRASYPFDWQALGDRLVINDDVFNWDKLPQSVALFGPGVIGLELGQALQRLGVKVWMFGRGGQLGPFSDEKVRHYANQLFANEFYLDLDAKVQDMHRVDEQVAITFTHLEEGNKNIAVDYVIAATGRRPNVDQLGLEVLDLALDDKGVPITDPHTMQTSIKHIFLAGDASNQLPLLHEANDQGRIAGHNAAHFPKVSPGLRHSALAIVFTAPQIALVGSTYAQLQAKTTAERHFNFAVGEVSFENQGRSRLMAKNQGLLRVYGEHGTGRFLGAEMLAPDAEHIAHLLAWAHQSKMTVAHMLTLPFYHPVIEEGLRTALRDLNANLALGAPIEDHCMECGVGD
ncbi:dihydrolipoyl dehydrogenase [Oceanisphaera avium]|uniref:Dihydrolipoyl dehydrogenase n=1 Tax=Oceanisphaera avium TaxID=1903694 RepID=A0A1Y0D036_9GAMM|nr:dihydrolipoyl dehydrogenase [Oceanisphaera avium]ART80950.1 dihydrolipoyl dehydrogenase [Oceanisphaera avium]